LLVYCLMVSNIITCFVYIARFILKLDKQRYVFMHVLHMRIIPQRIN